MGRTPIGQDSRITEGTGREKTKRLDRTPIGTRLSPRDVDASIPVGLNSRRV